MIKFNIIVNFKNGTWVVHKTHSIASSTKHRHFEQTQEKYLIV